MNPLLRLHINGPSIKYIYSTESGEIFTPILSGTVTFHHSSSTGAPDSFWPHIRLVRSVTTKDPSQAKGHGNKIVRLFPRARGNKSQGGEQRSSEETIVHYDLSESSYIIKPLDEGSEITANFSIIIPEDLPGTTDSILGDITYSLWASIRAEEGDTRHATRPVEIRRSIVNDDAGVKSYCRKFPDWKLSTKLILNCPPGNPKSDGIYSGRLRIQGDLAVSTGRASEISYAVVRQLKWYVQETVQLHKIQAGTPKNVCEQTRERKLCAGFRKGNWRLEDKETSFDNTLGPMAEIPFDFSVTKTPAPANDVELSCFERDPSNSCDHCAPGDLDPGATDRLAITVDHHLKVELIVGTDTFGRDTGALVARQTAQNVFGAVYPLKIENSTCTRSDPTEVCFDTWLPTYSDVPNAPPAYVALDSNVPATVP